ncbi:hypothetical protein ABT408_36485, partial [Streptomyces halstedii]
QAYGNERGVGAGVRACGVARESLFVSTELAAWAAEGVRGEITVVVEGAPDKGAEELDAAELVRRVQVREEAGERRKEAIAAVAAEAGIPKRDVFDAVVAAKNAARTTP